MCVTWFDHAWQEPRLVETGRHPVRGYFARYAIVCATCDRSYSQTVWRDAPVAPGGIGALPVTTDSE